MTSFADLKLPEQLLAAVTALKYETPTEIQIKSIPIALEGKDLIGSAQTGSGKTAAFGLPMVARLIADPTALGLVLAPTRELATQIRAVLQQIAIGAGAPCKVALLIGGAAMRSQMDALARKPRIIVATPGRLVDHLERRTVNLSNVKIIVLDEADRMLDLGFAAQLNTIRQQISTERQTLFFSATFPPSIAKLAGNWLTNPQRVSVAGTNAPFSSIKQEVVEVSGDKKGSVLLEQLQTRTGSILIFTATKRGADKISRLLMDNGHRATRLHGNRSQRQRDEAIEGFRKGRFNIMVATDIAARGLDIPNLSHVVNYDLPRCSEDYVHRIGRTARAGKTGEVLNLIAPGDRNVMNKMRRNAEAGESTPEGERSFRPRRSGGGNGRPQQRFRRGSGGDPRRERTGGGGFRERSFDRRDERSFNRREDGERSFERRDDRSFERRGTGNREQSFDRRDDRGFGNRSDRPAPRSGERSQERSNGRSFERRNDRNDRSPDRPFERKDDCGGQRFGPSRPRSERPRY